MKGEKVLNYKEFKRILLDNGFVQVRSRGSHNIFKRGKETIAANININRMVARRLIKEFNLIIK